VTYAIAIIVLLMSRCVANLGVSNPSATLAVQLGTQPPHVNDTVKCSPTGEGGLNYEQIENDPVSKGIQSTHEQMYK